MYFYWKSKPDTGLIIIFFYTFSSLHQNEPFENVQLHILLGGENADFQYVLHFYFS